MLANTGTTENVFQIDFIWGTGTVGYGPSRLREIVHSAGARLAPSLETARSAAASEQSVEAVAESVSAILGRPVSGAQIGALRIESTAQPDPAILHGLVSHFGIPSEYLTTSGPRADDVDKQLRLLAAARDAGVKRLALRGGAATDAADEVLDVIKRMPAEDA